MAIPAVPATPEENEEQDVTQAYPLQWPAGWPRMSAHGRKRAKFSKGTTRSSQRADGSWASWTTHSEISIDEGTKRIVSELSTMGIKDGQWIISSNLELRNDGLPRSNQRAPEDPGVAVYWTRKGKQQVMAIDIYDRVADNLAAVAASLNALRAIERHGGAQILDRAFAGFTALAAPDAFDPWAELGLDKRHGPYTAEQIQARFRDLSRLRHPDAGGTHDGMSRLTRARREALDAIQG